jgi:hypothetical protein
MDDVESLTEKTSSEKSCNIVLLNERKDCEYTHSQFLSKPKL